MKRGVLNYFADFFYATFRFHNGFTKPHSFIGYFNNQQLQKEFFKILLQEGFRRTPFQLVFPHQTAGLIKTVKNKCEYHVRFYNDGAIDCEEEVGRFHSLHYIGNRAHQFDLLIKILEKRASNKQKNQIIELFKEKPYPEKCIRKCKTQ